MKVLFPADGSKFTKKAMGFLVTHESLAGPEDEVLVLHVEPPVPPQVKSLLGSGTVHGYHEEEARKVLEPIERFLKRHKLNYRTKWVVGSPSVEIVKAAKASGSHLIVMGTHGHGVIGRALMGSVAQKVVSDCDIPVLLVK